MNGCIASIFTVEEGAIKLYETPKCQDPADGNLKVILTAKGTGTVMRG